ncbi:shikimate dehydrogenase [Campylobacter mucosalis]|uniref:shikimate dehydrogenase n=1 Tax=Campylobacter mucosalis TaxID=202 RepID=UPI00146FD9CA
MRVFAVFGNPISHSISPRLHNKAICDLGLSAVYTRICLENGSELIDRFKILKLSGANVTLPHKAYALELADIKSEMACKIGSANTLVLKDNKIYAHNTDAPGFLSAILPFGKIKTALILGAGGTAKAIAYALRESKIDVDLLNRSKDRFVDFAEFECFSYENFTPKPYDLIINSTSAGLNDENLPAPIEILSEIFSHSKFAFDVIYGRVTPFLDMSSRFGLTIKDGADMLLYQAVLALNLFYDNTLDLEKIKISMSKAFYL